MEYYREISSTKAADRLVLLMAKTREICRTTDCMVKESEKLVARYRRTSRLSPLTGSES